MGLDVKNEYYGLCPRLTGLEFLGKEAVNLHFKNHFR